MVGHLKPHWEYTQGIHRLPSEASFGFSYQHSRTVLTSTVIGISGFFL